MRTTPLTGDSSIADWLADPAGNAILTEMLAQSGQSPEVFKPVPPLPTGQATTPATSANHAPTNVAHLVASPPTRRQHPPAPRSVGLVAHPGIAATPPDRPLGASVT